LPLSVQFGATERPSIRGALAFRHVLGYATSLGTRRQHRVQITAKETGQWPDWPGWKINSLAIGNGRLLTKTI